MSPRAPARSGLRVLIAEDDPSSRKVLTHALETLRAELTVVENGLEAVQAFAREPFDVVLMDLQMPVMDGYTAMREIRSMESRSGRTRTPVLVVSAHTRQWELDAAESAGADHHLAKPLSVPQLLGTIDAVVEPL